MTGALIGGAVPGVGLPLDKLLDGAFGHQGAEAKRKLKRFTEAMAAELASIGPREDATRAAAGLKIEAALRSNPLSHRRLVELDLDAAAATAELAEHLVFATTSERTELEHPCRDLIHRYYAQLPRHAHSLAAMLPDLWAVTLRRLDDLHELVATMATNDAERRDLQAEVDRLRADGHLRDRAIVALLQDVGERFFDPPAYPGQLRRAGERYRDLLAEAERPHDLPARLEAVREDAAAHIREGRLDDADNLLLELRQAMGHGRADRESMLEQAKRDEAIVLAERAQIAETRLRYRAAAALLAEAADLTSFDPETSWRHRITQAKALYDQGSELGDNAALAEAIAAGEKALDLAPRDTRPADWAATQNNLGLALQTLGSRRIRTAILERAVAAFEAALLEYSRERTPLDWATTQLNLGNALATLGRWESGTDTLERAVEAYEAALLEHTRERVPLSWANTQSRLGVALWTLGERESGTATLERAVAAYEAALLEYTRERVPLDWATTQLNLGNALRVLGSREFGFATLERAVRAYEAALLEHTRERVPFEWAGIQNNLGIALQTLGNRESGTTSLARAVAAFEAALLEWTREHAPVDWSATQCNLGVALWTLGSRESGTATLERAVDACAAALQERTRERFPYLWAQTRENMAIAILNIGRRSGDIARLHTALALVDGALDEYRRSEAEHDIEMAERLRFGILAALESCNGV